MAFAPFGFAELLTIVMMLGGPAGVPVGVPPGPEDPLLAKIAPAECLYYTTWAGVAEPDGSSGNQTEQLLAEPEVREALTSVEATIRRLLLETAAREGDPNATLAADAAPKLIRTLLTRPTALYLTSVTPRDGGPPDVRGGAIVNCGDKAAETRELLERLQRAALSGAPAGDVVEEVTIGDGKFHRIRLPDPDAPLITWGVRGEYLIVGVGEGEVEAILERGKTDAPTWLVEARKSVTVPRTSSFAYLNVKEVRELLLPLAPDPSVEKYVAAAGLMNVNTYTAVTGLDETGFVSRSLLAIDGDAKGVFALADAKPLTADDLKIVPQGAAAAFALRLDPDTTHETVMSVISEADPRIGDGAAAALIGAGGALGIDLREDVFKSLGDTWYVYSDPGAGGYLTGWTAVVKVRNRMQLEEVHSKLLRIAEASMPPGGRNPRIKHTSFEGHDIYHLSVPDDDMLVAPSWCLTDDYLVAGLYPQTIKAFLTRGEDFKSLSEAPEVANLFEGDGRPLLVGYVDTEQFFEPLYSLLQLGAQVGFAQAQRQGIDVDITLLPSAGAIKKHLRPSVSVVQRTDAGIEMVAKQTIPGGNVGTTAPIMAALLLPAVQSAREAARRTASRNNLRQIGLAMHNYHDVSGALPAAYSTDEDDKPLLSWRVHILPYIEEGALYERFHLDEPWDSEHNRELIPLMPPIYRSPNSTLEPGKSNYLTVRIEKGMLTAPRDGEGVEMPRGISFASIPDGTSNTILAVEVTDEKAVEWTKPDDFVPPMRNPLEGLTGMRPGGFNALFGDGSVEFLSESIDHEMLRNMFTRDDGNRVDR